MSAIVANNVVRQLDSPAQTEEQVTQDQVQDPERLVRLLARLIKDVALLKRRFWPRRTDYEDLSVDGTGATKYRLAHGFGGRVRWLVSDWSGASAGPQLMRSSDTDNDTLVLVSYVAGTVTVRVEEAG